MQKKLLDVRLNPKNFKNYEETIPFIDFLISLHNDETKEIIANAVLYNDQDPNYTILKVLTDINSKKALFESNSNAIKFISILTKLINQMDIDLLLKDINSIKIDILYRYFEPKKQEIIRNYLNKYFENFALPEPLTLKNLLLLTSSKKFPPSFVTLKLESKVSPGTQSKLHFISSLARNLKPLRLTTKDIEFFLRIYAQEKIEDANGHYVFFHGRQWKWNYFSDIYKQLWNLTKNDQVGENFQFLRFGKAGGFVTGLDILFMNSAIFGNISSYGSNTASFWLDNIDWSKNIFFNTEYLFKQFNLENIYKKYEKEFKQLQELHAQASEKGEILLISVARKDLNNIYLTRVMVILNVN